MFCLTGCHWHIAVLTCQNDLGNLISGVKFCIFLDRTLCFGSTYDPLSFHMQCSTSNYHFTLHQIQLFYIFYVPSAASCIGLECEKYCSTGRLILFRNSNYYITFTVVSSLGLTWWCMVGTFMKNVLLFLSNKPGRLINWGLFALHVPQNLRERYSRTIYYLQRKSKWMIWWWFFKIILEIENESAHAFFDLLHKNSKTCFFVFKIVLADRTAKATTFHHPFGSAFHYHRRVNFTIFKAKTSILQNWAFVFMHLSDGWIFMQNIVCCFCYKHFDQMNWQTNAWSVGGI